MLLFKKKYLDAIRRGEKTQTIRLWPHRRMRVGQRSYIPGVGYIRIESVDEVALGRLTDDDARRDGFPDRATLLAEIEQLYVNEPSERHRPFRIIFSMLSPAEAEQARRDKEAKKAARRNGAADQKNGQKKN
ncbi:MAG: ASCH domain-containing protein [Pirellulales bacterium]|nr:ASCH domain-containing protein [Planctomycetales bacterium]